MKVLTYKYLLTFPGVLPQCSSMNKFVLVGPSGQGFPLFPIAKYYCTKLGDFDENVKK